LGIRDISLAQEIGQIQEDRYPSVGLVHPHHAKHVPGREAVSDPAFYRARAIPSAVTKILFG